MEDLREVIAESLGVFTKKELETQVKSQMLLLASENYTMSLEVYHNFLYRRKSKKKSHTILTLSLILAWRAVNKISQN